MNLQKHSLFRIFLSLLAAALTTFCAHAQSNLAQLRGSVTDPQNLAVPESRVRIVAADSGVSREVLTNGTGLYEFAGLQPGRYTLTIQASGFQQQEEPLELEVGQQETIDIHLGIGSATQTVAVRSNAELLKTDDSSVGEVVDQRSVDSLPLNGRMLIDVNSDPAPGITDGLRVDTKGNLWETGPGGVWIISPQGKHLGTILLPELGANVEFGDADRKTLYIAARTSIYRIKTNIAGIP